MRMQWLKRHVVLLALILGAMAQSAFEGGALAADPAPANVLLVVGPSLHPAGTHEVPANARLMKHCLEHAQGVTPMRAEIVTAWPKDAAALKNAATVVFFGDIFPAQTLPEPQRVRTDLAAMMDRGCGLVCVHYATGLRAQDVAEDGDHPLLRWMGGYFATGCKHHQSVARVMRGITMTPEAVDHPVLRGWKAYTFDDEPYYNNYFGPAGPAKNVTPLVTSMLPPESPRKEIVAWAVERPDGGRGVGIVFPHFFRNWEIEDMRTFALNSVCWTAKLEIPPAGVRASLPNLATFAPGAVDAER